MKWVKLEGAGDVPLVSDRRLWSVDAARRSLEWTGEDSGQGY